MLLPALACVVCAAAMLRAAPARADGDPASDVLASQALFLPADGSFTQGQAARLTGLLASARRHGYPIRVALIATKSDLGSVSALWRQPQAYAQFLGQELSLVYRGTLLVAMPNGFGVEHVASGSSGGSQTAAAQLPRVTGSMATSAVTAVQALAGAAGHRLTPSPATAAPSSGSALDSVDLGSWLALAAGVAVIAAAWTFSLRAQPPGRLRRAEPNG
ncbi:MAG: hypothetical protein WAL63_19740 [Solirubrobacteraceae bacterium]